MNVFIGYRCPCFQLIYNQVISAGIENTSWTMKITKIVIFQHRYAKISKTFGHEKLKLSTETN